MVHGALVASVFSSLLAGVAPGCVYVAQDLRFRVPVRAGEAVTGCVHVERVRGRRGRGRGGVVLECRTRAYRHEAPPSAAATDDDDSSGARPAAATLAVDGRARVWLPAGYGIEG